MDGVTIEWQRCRWCLAPIVLSPFVNQWMTIPDSACPLGPSDWRLHELLLSYGPDRVMAVMNDLLDVVSA